MSASMTADGKLALAIFNRNPEAEAAIVVNWSELGLKKAPRAVRDAWRHQEINHTEESLSVRLSADGVGLFVVTP